MDRREFVKTAAIVTSAGAAISASARAAPSDRVRLGFIGSGGRGRSLMKIFSAFPDVEIPVICDVIEPRMDLAMKELAAVPRPQRPERVVEYRRILDRKDIDAVVIATTQHWHGLPHIHACQAGKHIFVEKPLSHTVVEGRAMVNATRKYGVIALMGVQQRAGPHYKKAVEIARSGQLGKIALVECWNYHNAGKRVEWIADSEPPPGYHWDLWLGPAPSVPFNRARLNHAWWFDYGGGFLTNWAVHHIDIILWAMNVDTPSTVVSAGGKLAEDDMADSYDTLETCWRFPGFVMTYRYRGFSNFHVVQQRPRHHGICFYGDKATMVLDRFGYEIWSDDDAKEWRLDIPEARRSVERMDGYPQLPGDGPKNEQDGPFQRYFLDCLKAGKQPDPDIEFSHRATVCCHLGNIAYHTGRAIHWDGERETILGDHEACKLLDRPRRKGYELPPVT